MFLTLFLSGSIGFECQYDRSTRVPHGALGFIFGSLIFGFLRSEHPSISLLARSAAIAPVASLVPLPALGCWTKLFLSFPRSPLWDQSVRLPYGSTNGRDSVPLLASRRSRRFHRFWLWSLGLLAAGGGQRRRGRRPHASPPTSVASSLLGVEGGVET